MPAKKNTDEPPAEVEGPNPAQAAAAEEVPAAARPDVPDGMVAVPFRGSTVVVYGPRRSAKSAKVRLAIADNDADRILAGLFGKRGTQQFAELIDEDDDFDAVVAEFFEAYGKATGQGNS